MAEARVQLAQLQRDEAQAAIEARAAQRDEQEESGESSTQVAATTANPQQKLLPAPNLDLYAQLSGLEEAVPVIDLVT
jgi:hypothetical protein